jgi:hypothetical protein
MNDMTHRSALTVLLAGLALALVGAQGAAADPGHGNRLDKKVVFVQTNELTGNQIVVFDRGVDGRLVRAGTYATGGNGGAAAPGTESDRLASQDSLVYDSEHKQLIAVNAGSDTVSAFRVHRDRLKLEDVLSSAGPASIAVHASWRTCSTRAVPGSSRDSGSAATGWSRSRALHDRSAWRIPTRRTS